MSAGYNHPDDLYADALAKIRVHTGKPLGAYDARNAAKPDPVTKPAHYQRAGIETIDYIRATLTAPGFEAYCIGNVLKYVSRYREKGGIEDLRKARVYLGWAIEPVKPENAAAVREAKVAYDMACDRTVCTQGEWDGFRMAAALLGMNVQPEPPKTSDYRSDGRVPKWHADYPKSQHPMAAESLRDFERDDNASGV